MIEVLVSIVVLSFGLLGMVGMQAAAMQSNREARLQSLGVQYARELAELARGNKAVALRSKAGDNPYLMTDFVGTVSTAPRNCLADKCADVDLASWEVAEWQKRVKDTSVGLPDVRVTTCFDSAPYDSSGKPQWDCSPGDGMQLVVKIGWTQRTTDRTKTGASALLSAQGNDAKAPLVTIPISPGVI